MARMLEASTGSGKLLSVVAGLCRHVLDGLGGDDPIGDAEALGVEPGEFPEALLRTPDGAPALGALAQLGLVVRDAHGDYLVVAPARATGRGRQGADETINSTVL